MSIPSNYINELLIKLSQNRIENIIAQTDARRILQEIRENPENYPDFDPVLTEKATHVAYVMLSCGCSLIENQDSDTSEGFAVLEKAGKILSDAFKYNPNELETRDYNLLVAGMALYAAKQYSRAFIILNDINTDFAVGQMIIQFVKKDFKSLLQFASNIFFSQTSEQKDVREFDEWVISHEIARCFLVIIDFVHTGNQENFKLIDDIVMKMLTLASYSNLTLYWLIIRLLKIIFSTYQESSLWSVLPPLLPARYITSKYIRLLSGFKSPVTEMWPSQTAALPLAVGENSGAIINLRTSGGKTRVAEIAILKTLSTKIMSKVLYLAPFRSLAFEIEQSLNKTFGPLGITVSQLYGGSTANVTDFELINQSQIIIATPEKAKALIRCGSGLEAEVKLIVVDEGHLLGAEERYIKNEMFLTHIKEYASRNQIRLTMGSQ
ncbi:DEAD/DEAH box helicase [Clostridium sp. WB02_MRS01]|uniref:DEAD/DEAH box helicase n=1 Tax=Clostridium sp. WB02_MRS01 TaxID=2605777 RepID=UPI0012B2CF0C|nr:DEAD/DEAH box helicase [Clostridium sp. WB02_MRS01]MSS11822.1 DEAD/DEAH box helicase [Clostridium sp. WB02_MRS01]